MYCFDHGDFSQHFKDRSWCQEWAVVTDLTVWYGEVIWNNLGCGTRKVVE